MSSAVEKSSSMVSKALEGSVSVMSEENAQLREKLTFLRAARGETSNLVVSDPTASALKALASPALDIDYAYIGKLQAELVKAKATLLERQLQLVRLKGDSLSTDGDAARQTLLERMTTLSSIQTEKKALERMTQYLDGETLALSQHRQVVQKAINGEPVDLPSLGSVAAVEAPLPELTAEERATSLLDVRGWLEATLRGWTQVRAGSHH